MKKKIEQEGVDIEISSKSTLEPTDKVTLTDDKILVKSGRLSTEVSIDAFKQLLNSNQDKLEKQLKQLLEGLTTTEIYLYDSNYQYIKSTHIVYDFNLKKLNIPANSTTIKPPKQVSTARLVFNTNNNSWIYSPLEKVVEVVKSFEDYKLDRNCILDKTDKLVLRHRDEIFLGKQTTLTNEQFVELQDYRNRLRVMFEFDKIIFPTKPDFI